LRHFDAFSSQNPSIFSKINMQLQTPPPGKPPACEAFESTCIQNQFIPDAPHYGVQNSGIKQKSDAARHIPSGMRICGERAGV